jgi:hypothetical protein
MSPRASLSRACEMKANRGTLCSKTKRQRAVRPLESFDSTDRFASESVGFAQDDILETVSPSFSAALGR